MHEIYPWLTPLWQKWQSLSETQRVSGAMLCSALPGSGVGELARQFSRTLVCSNSDSEPCGFCHSCELTKSGNHPDIHLIEPEKEGKSITVDQIRLCNQWALESSQLAGKRVIIISPAEAMNESASNALLKTLESPPEHCIFLLLSHNRSKLLPTIISRCQKWEVPEPHTTETYNWLISQTDKPCNHTGIRLCYGAPLKALDFFEQDLYSEFQSLEASLLNHLNTGVLDYTQVWKQVKENPVRNFSWLSVLMGDVQKRHFGLNEEGLCEQSAKLSEIVSYPVAYKAMLSINTIKDQLEQSSGLNAELLLANWLIEIQEEICL